MTASPRRTPYRDLRRVSVTTEAIDGKVMVRDTLGREYEIGADVRVGSGPPPRPGELWIMLTETGVPRMLLARIGASTPVVSGARAGNTPLVLSLLDALSALGLVDDQST